MLPYFNHSVKFWLLDNAKLTGLLIGHSHLPTKMNLSIPPSCWKIFIAIINCSGGRCLWAGLKVIISLKEL